ncbi:MAG: alpha/beta hydrolase [Thermoplasmatota archaeon]
MKRAAVGAALLLLLLTGCLQPTSDVEVTIEGPATEPLVDPAQITFDILTRTGGASTVAGLTWWPENATTAILLVHGFSGVKENYWHTLPEAGYSWGSRIAASGRAAVAIDLPGYGESPGLDPASGLDDLAWATTQVGAALRLERPGVDVVGYGLSMGGYIVAIAQGLFGAFDAIIPASSPHAGFVPGALTCGLIGGDGCASDVETDFHPPNADPAVVNATFAGYEPITDHAANLASLNLWLGDCGAPAGFGVPTCTGTSPLEVATDRITAPVLSLLGDKDLLLDASRWQDEPGHFPASRDAQVILVPDNGHFIHNHLDRAVTWGHVDAWLAGHGL